MEKSLLILNTSTGSFLIDTNTIAERENTTVNIFNPGNYTIRLYDVDARAYISSQPVTLTKGINKTIVQAKVEKDKFTRADLFKDEMLVHYTDVSKK